MLKNALLQNFKTNATRNKDICSCDRGGKNVNKVVEGAASDFESEPVYTMQDTTAPSLMQRMKVNGEVLEFEIDAGSKK